MPCWFEMLGMLRPYCGRSGTLGGVWVLQERPLTHPFLGGVFEWRREPLPVNMLNFFSEYAVPRQAEARQAEIMLPDHASWSRTVAFVCTAWSHRVGAGMLPISVVGTSCPDSLNFYYSVMKRAT